MKDKFILDACCGGRMFWVDKHHKNTIYMDKRKDVLPLKEQYGINFTVEPDLIADFTNMPFDNNSFKLVIFDPPHLIMNKTAWMAKKYGTLKNIDWKTELKKGFLECWRVLENYGMLLFKWNDCSIKIKEIKELFPSKPLIFNKVKSKANMTYWYSFMKIPEEIETIS